MAGHFVKRAVLIIGLLTVVVLFPIVAFAQNDAVAAINSARQPLVTFYTEARKAESAGANISSLTSILNDAGSLFSQSELAYSQGDFTKGQRLSSQVGQQLTNFVSNANALRDTAAQQQSFSFWLNVVGSIAGSLVVIVMGLTVWLVLKKRYMVNQVEAEAHTNEPSRD